MNRALEPRTDVGDGVVEEAVSFPVQGEAVYANAASGPGARALIRMSRLRQLFSG